MALCKSYYPKALFTSVNVIFILRDTNCRNPCCVSLGDRFFFIIMNLKGQCHEMKNCRAPKISQPGVTCNGTKTKIRYL